MKKYIQRLCIAAFVILTASFSVNEMASANSIGDLQEKVKQHEQEKSTISEEKENINSDKNKTETKMNDNKNEQKSVSEQISDLETELKSTENDIENVEANIEQTDSEIKDLNNRIEVLKEEIVILEEKIESRNELLKDRLRSIQVTGGEKNYLQVIFDATSFADFVGRATAVNTIMDQDQLIMEEQAADVALLEQNKQEVEESRVLVEAKKEEQESQKENLVALKNQLDDQKEEHQSLLAQLEEEHTELEEIKLTLEEEQAILSAEESAQAQAIAQAQKEIGKLERLAREEEERKRKEAEEKKRQEEVAAAARAAKESEETVTEKPSQAAPESSTASVVEAPDTQVSSSGGGSSSFIHPVNSGTGSPFGMRFHPIHKENRMHNGVDYPVGTGTPIRASADGVVSTAGVMGGFGNVVMISHYIDGQTYTTVYAHLSGFSVSPGQTVSQGQTIATSGNTGASTGPHLHFELRRGGFSGTPINPLSMVR